MLIKKKCVCMRVTCCLHPPEQVHWEGVVYFILQISAYILLIAMLRFFAILNSYFLKSYVCFSELKRDRKKYIRNV